MSALSTSPALGATHLPALPRGPAVVRTPALGRRPRQSQALTNESQVISWQFQPFCF